MKYIITFLIIGSFFCSCGDFLDESPDDRLDLDTLEKAAKVVGNAYSKGSYVFTDWCTDYAGPIGLRKNSDGVSLDAGGNEIRDEHIQIYTWDNVTELSEDTPDFYWNNAYEAIAHANEVLAVIDELPGDAEFRNAIKGEALLCRAYHHFMLVNIFGKHYDDTAASDLGIPYIFKPEIEFLPIYERNSVKEVYDFVERDMLEGLSLVNDKFYLGTKKYHFTRKAALAFASRFYLWKRDYERCLKYSDLFLDGNPQKYVKDFDEVYSGSGFNEIAQNYGAPEDDSNVMVAQQFTVYTRRGRGFGLNIDGLNEIFSNLFTNVLDERVGRNIFNFSGQDVRWLPRLREFFFREDLSSDSGQPYYIAVVFKGEEVLLNRAEAQLSLKRLQEAIDDINILAENRYEGNTYSREQIIAGYSQFEKEDRAILQLIRDERRKEFWDHGLRWFDIKRYKETIEHQLPVQFGGEKFFLSEDDPKKALQIPAAAIAQGIIPNPR